jgi:hypothetical protein
MMMFDVANSSHAPACGQGLSMLHAELAERLAETQFVMSFARLLPEQSAMASPNAVVVPFVGREG